MDELAQSWERLQNAILEERFDKLPPELTIREFADLVGAKPGVIQARVRSGALESTTRGRIRLVDRDSGRAEILDRLRSDRRLRVVRSRRAPLARISSHVDDEVFALLVSMVQLGAGGTGRRDS